MATHLPSELTQNNRLYLYRLFRDALGCGRQTFITQAEEALVNDGLDATSLGFEDVRALLEALDEFAVLTVFKGGRVYVTINALSEWDDVLEATDAGSGNASPKGGKPWKRKRGQRALKPVRPRPQMVEVSVQEPSTSETDDMDECAQAQDAPVAAKSAGSEESAALEDNAVQEEPAPELVAQEAVDTQVTGSEIQMPEEPAEQPTQTASPTSEAEHPNQTTSEENAPEEAAEEPSTAPQPTILEPAISLTVTYDPENASAGVQTLESTPVAGVETNDATPDGARPDNLDAGARPEAAPATAEHVQNPVADAAAARPVVDTSIYPMDFAADVWCPAELLSTLAGLLPLGADALGIAGEWFLIALERGTAELARNRAAFPLRYLRDGERRSATIRLKRRPATDAGVPWIIESIETD